MSHLIKVLWQHFNKYHSSVKANSKGHQTEPAGLV